MSLNCPHCQSLVAIDAVTGLAPEHCPYCDGLMGDTSQGDRPEVDALAANHDAPATDAPTEAQIQADDDASGQALAEASPQVEPVSALDTSALPVMSAAAAPKRKKSMRPSFTRPRAISQTTHRARWPKPVAATLGLVLALQLVVADRASLAADARWRSTMLRFCQVLRCDIPAWHEVTTFTMLNRDVRAHPTAANALRVHAAFRNDAHWPQPWPELVLTLSDATGRVTGSRSFTAMEYLGDAPTQKLIATGQTANFVLDVAEPAPNTVSFSFDFR
ncbi:MAG: DUF3426 domain-containing protein [Lysobacter sp.]|nr:DUF3426 domain-containing protein [Lysobacter sp.]